MNNTRDQHTSPNASAALRLRAAASLAALRRCLPLRGLWRCASPFLRLPITCHRHTMQCLTNNSAMQCANSMRFVALGCAEEVRKWSNVQLFSKQAFKHEKTTKQCQNSPLWTWWLKSRNVGPQSGSECGIWCHSGCDCKHYVREKLVRHRYKKT